MSDSDRIVKSTSMHVNGYYTLLDVGLMELV